MSDFKIVKPNELQTLEEYGASLLFGAASLKTLEAYQLEAFKKGLFDDDEKETSKTICWEIQRLLALYKNQLAKIQERTGFDEAGAINNFRKVMPEVTIPRKRRKKNDGRKTQ